MRIKCIGGIEIGRAKPFLILEAGVNHEGSLSKAFEMIDAGAEAGADMIKFQSYKAETLASRHSPAYWDRHQEPTGSQYELFKKHDSFGDAEYVKLSERCVERGILFCSTAFDSHFVDFLEAFMPVYKVASADITNFPILSQVGSKGKPVLLSVGASYLGEVEAAVRLLRQSGSQELALMHCVLEYPTAAAHANLESIPYLQRVFGDVTIGWSDHVTPAHGCLSLLMAWVAGADILEKHYTLDKSLPGNDHYHAMDPDDVREFVARQGYVFRMMGEGGKRVQACEETPRRYARRSLVATCDIPAGTTLKAEMLTAKRPGTGISPIYHDLVVGRKTITEIKEDELLQWDKL